MAYTKREVPALDEQFNLTGVAPAPQGGTQGGNAGDNGGYSGASTKVNHVYGEERQDPADVTEKRDEAQDLYTKGDRQAQQAEQSEALNDVDRSYDAADMRRRYGFWDENIAKNSPLGNLNNRSFDTTLGMQRLVDALNNRLHYKGGQIGRRTNSSFGTHEGQIGTAERWDPLETEETRQMAANRNIDAAARSRQMARAENVQDYPLELRKAYDDAQIELIKHQQRTGVDFARAVQDIFVNKEYGDSWTANWNVYTNAFAQAVPYNLRNEFFNAMQSIGNYIDKQGYASVMQPGMSVANPIVKSLWDSICANYSSDPATMLAALYYFNGIGMSGFMDYAKSYLPRLGGS